MKWYSKKWFEYFENSLVRKKNFYHFMPQSFQFLRTFLVIFFWKCSVSEGVKQTKKWQNLLILAIGASIFIALFFRSLPIVCEIHATKQVFFVFLQDMWTFKCTCVILQSFCPKNDFLCEMKLKCCSILNFQTSGFTSKNLCINCMESKVHGVQLNSNQFLWLNFQINY